MTATVAYECELCIDESPEVAWRSSADEMGITPDGRQIYECCWSELCTLDWPDWQDRQIPQTLYLAEENPETVADRMDALAKALIEVTREYREEREIAYDSLTAPDGRYDCPKDKAAIEEMDAIITRATETLTAAGYSLDDETETVTPAQDHKEAGVQESTE